eukprot:GHVS01074583.1.p1 GENE.GHVS01074583.1~~GHVS01074583.1.p1  ORF type:complete len:276 (-),score=21.85 GHVS01074583.1:82-909(-)
MFVAGVSDVDVACETSSPKDAADMLANFTTSLLKQQLGRAAADMVVSLSHQGAAHPTLKMVSGRPVAIQSCRLSVAFDNFVIPVDVVFFCNVDGAYKGFDQVALVSWILQEPKYAAIVPVGRLMKCTATLVSQYFSIKPMCSFGVVLFLEAVINRLSSAAATNVPTKTPIVTPKELLLAVWQLLSTLGRDDAQYRVKVTATGSVTYAGKWEYVGKTDAQSTIGLTVEDPTEKGYDASYRSVEEGASLTLLSDHVLRQQAFRLYQAALQLTQSWII